MIKTISDMKKFKRSGTPHVGSIITTAIGTGEIIGLAEPPSEEGAQFIVKYLDANGKVDKTDGSAGGRFSIFSINNFKETNNFEKVKNVRKRRFLWRDEKQAEEVDSEEENKATERKMPATNSNKY